MKKIVLLSAFLTLCSVAFANSGKYKIDDASIEAVIANATEVSSDFVALDDAASFASAATTTNLNASKNPWAAWGICWVVGEFGVHRHYLGTKSSMWAIYTFTCCGIFGIVPLVDWVVLLIGAINDDIRKYENNTQFFMW